MSDLQGSGINIFVPNNLGGVVGTVLGTFTGNPGQTFQTKPLPNSRLALYSLVIRSATPPHPAILSYIFPLSPASVRRESTSMTNIYDVASATASGGVQRIADLYGQSPTTFSIEGTTGWQYHATDNFLHTGIESALALQAALTSFGTLNAQQQAAGNNSPYIMEFYDYFEQDYWQVVPVGKQVFSITQARPLLIDYSIQLAGIQSLNSAPPVPQDALAGLGAASSHELAVALTSELNAALVKYQPTVLGFLPSVS